MAADPITWPVAISIIGGVAVACVTFFGFIRQAFKKETPWKDPLDRLNSVVVRLESELKSLNEKLDDVQDSVSVQETRYNRDFDRMHERLEKVTDLMIDILRVDNSTPNDKS